MDFMLISPVQNTATTITSFGRAMHLNSSEIGKEAFWEEAIKSDKARKAADEDELKKLRLMVSNAKGANIKIRRKVYPGVHISIDTCDTSCKDVFDNIIFIKQQENERFLEELCQLLEQENLYNLEGISQDLYFALCISYHIWEENDSMSDQATDSALERLIDLLHQHPKHTEYVKDLHIWEDIKRDRRLVHFCQQAVSLANRRWIKPEEKKAFLAEAEELFLQSTMLR